MPPGSRAESIVNGRQVWLLVSVIAADLSFALMAERNCRLFCIVQRNSCIRMGVLVMYGKSVYEKARAIIPNFSNFLVNIAQDNLYYDNEYAMMWVINNKEGLRNET